MTAAALIEFTNTPSGSRIFGIDNSRNYKCGHRAKLAIQPDREPEQLERRYMHNEIAVAMRLRREITQSRLSRACTVSPRKEVNIRM